MPLSNSVIRRYTPPTCTLEVLAQSSPLSRWMGKTVLKQLNFELRFDDPRLPEERRVPIRGDRDQLEALYDAVTSYIQEFLQQSPENFSLSFLGTQDSTTTLDEPKSKDFQQSSLSAKTLKTFTYQIPGAKIYLEPGSNLTHNLFLGSLANQASGSVIGLSLLQLFDLASALDEYAADVVALPNLNNSSSSFRLPTWAPVAAVLVLALGLTPFTWQYANSIRQRQQQTAKKTDPTQAKIALESSASPNFPTPQAELTPSNSLQSLPPLGSTSGLSTSNLPQKPLTAPGSSLPTTSQTFPNSSFTTVPPLSPKGVLNTPQATTSTLPTNPGIATSTKIPGRELAIQPNSGQNPTGLNTQAGIALSQGRNLPTQLPSSTGSLSSSVPTVPPPLATIPDGIRGNTLPQSASQQPGGRINSSGAVSARKIPSTTSSRTGDNNPFIDRLGDGSKNPTPRKEATNSTLFDTPQIAEAREYIGKRWQPPSGLAQTLEYSLILGVDGTIERILPLNKVARDYFDTAGMPDIGKPFVSANKNGQNLRIRVVLSPDGKVQTFPENK